MPEEIIKNVFRIPVPLAGNPLKLLNSYVIKGEDKSLIIDTGFKHPDCRDALINGLRELKIDIEKTDILLTHLHSDHSGLAPELAMPGRKVYISRAEIPWMFGESRTARWKEDNVKIVRSGFPMEVIRAHLTKAPSRDMSPDPNFSDYSPVDNGDVFSYGGYELEAVATPGHTPEHMCFWVESEKLMFTGDHVLFDITPNITLWNEVEDSLGDYLESLKKIDKYDVRLALPGHRETGDFHARIAKLLAHHDERLEECLQVVREKPGSTVFEVAGKMKWNIRCSSWEDFPIGQKWFAVSECHSHLRHLEKLGRVHCDYSGELFRYTAI